MPFQTQFHDGQVTQWKNPLEEPAVKNVLHQIQLNNFHSQNPCYLRSHLTVSPNIIVVAIISCPGVSNSSLVLILPRKKFSQPWLLASPTPVFPLPCTLYHFPKWKGKGQGTRRSREPSLQRVEWLLFPWLTFRCCRLTPADPPYELVSRNVSLLGVWRSETVLMPAPHTEDFISFLIFCLGAPTASNFPQLLGAVESVASLGPFSVPTPFLTTLETSGPTCNWEAVKYRYIVDTLSLVNDCCGSRGSRY